MKFLYAILALIFVCSSCKPKQQIENGGKEDEALIFTMPEDSIKTATAIVWVDKNDKKGHDRMKTRAAKAKVTISEDGKITVIAFVKNYPKEVQNYIKHKLINFRVSKPMMEYDYIKPGEQFLQFRYSAYLMADYDFLYK